MPVQKIKQFKYIFYISKNYSIPVFIPLLKYLESTGHSYRFYISNKVKKKFPQEWDSKKILPSLKEAIKFNPDFVLSTGNFVDFRIPGIKVQLFHGLGVEKDAHFKIRHFFDIYLTSGPYVTTRFKQLQKKHKYFIVKETGWPKIDYILDYPKKELEKLKLPDTKKIILYAPTFSSKHESASALLDIIPYIIKDNEFWLFKFHELMDKSVIKKVENMDISQVKVLGNTDITPYFHAADVLISDTSSVVYEFMVLDKPIITYRTQAREDKALNITDPNMLREVLDRSLQKPKELSSIREKHLQEINPYLDGKISQNVFKTLEEIIISKQKIKRKPLNVFRKIQIVYHSLFREGYLR
jgi:CDP-glycerol glycerophosphotransferase (TagB/SpsB family)